MKNKKFEKKFINDFRDRRPNLDLEGFDWDAADDWDYYSDMLENLEEIDE